LYNKNIGSNNSAAMLATEQKEVNENYSDSNKKRIPSIQAGSVSFSLRKEETKKTKF
jgi:hypothetical protein